MPFSPKLLTLQGNCKNKQCFICHALSLSRTKLDTKKIKRKLLVIMLLQVYVKDSMIFTAQTPGLRKKVRGH